MSVDVTFLLSPISAVPVVPRGVSEGGKKTICLAVERDK